MLSALKSLLPALISIKIRVLKWLTEGFSPLRISWLPHLSAFSAQLELPLSYDISQRQALFAAPRLQTLQQAPHKKTREESL